MFANDLILAFVFMAILFLRQISILKLPNKINYSPLMLGIGAISSVVHFIINPNPTDTILLLRESFFPMLVALLLYIVMNILHQTQQSESARTQDEFLRVLVSEIIDLKEFMLDIKTQIEVSQHEDQRVQGEVRKKFKDDLKALEMIKVNQDRFYLRFDEMEAWHKDVTKSFEHFTDEQLPELDNVVHKHIDILRVAEQDHYNQLKSILNKAVDSRGDIATEMELLKNKLNGMKNITDEIARTIIKHTLEQLSGVSKSFEMQMIALKAHSESVETSLSESENKLDGIRTKSELIMKQMLLSSKKMDELQRQNSGLHDVHLDVESLIKDIEMIKMDYVKAQSRLSFISQEMATSKDEKIEIMKEQINFLGDFLSKKIDESLVKLHEHFHIAEGDITQSVQILNKKVQSKKGYGGFEAKESEKL